MRVRRRKLSQNWRLKMAERPNPALEVAALISDSAPQPQMSNKAKVGWNHVNNLIEEELTATLFGLNHNLITTEMAADTFSDTVQRVLKAKNVIKTKQKTTLSDHRPRQIERLVENLRQEKNKNRGRIVDQPQAFLHSMRAHNKALKDLNSWKRQRSSVKQEQAFWKNRWSFAKSACQPGMSVPSEPTFNSQTALAFFRSQHSPNDNETLIPSWVRQVLPSSYTSQFDLSPITPGIVKKVLKNTNKNSSPGEDEIRYSHLWNLPFSHQFLATLFSKILFQSQSCPERWCTARMKLVHKEGSTDDPSNFRPLAITSVVGKLFHKILALRMERYCLDNSIIDPSVQKGFLKNITGTYEHIFALNAILDQAIEQKRDLSISFLDLKNAFGSVSHSLIFEILYHLQIPLQVTNYIKDCYSRLRGYVQTKSWTTPKFPISRGVFQSDTLSPIIFLTTFSPILLLIQKWEHRGFQMIANIPGSEDLPPPESTIYVLWEEDNGEQKGWYRATVEYYSPNGKAHIHYANNDQEDISLHSCSWRYATKRNRVFVPTDGNLPKEPQKQVPPQLKSSIGSEHKAKCFADDLTLLSPSMEDHQSALTDIEGACNDLGLALKPPKCVSLTLHKGRPKKSAKYQLRTGKTRNLCDGGHTKFLGQVVAATTSTTKTVASKVFQDLMMSALKNVDSRPI